MSSQAPRHIKEIVGSNIRAAREQLGLTQRDLAQRLDVDPQYVSRWERGTVMPSIGNVHALSEHLKVGMGWLYMEHADEREVV